MKAFKYYLFFAQFIYCTFSSFDQGAIGQNFSANGSPLEYKMRDLDQFRNTRDRYSFEVSYVINGQQVLGSPFLYYNWLHGTVVTKDGRTYTDYNLKYDVYNQDLFFQNGKDALKVEDEISSFTLIDSTNVLTFVNANQVKNSKVKGYLEVLVNDKKGMLLKQNKKKVSDETFGIPIYSSKKHFENGFDYFFYNPEKAKTEKIQLLNSNVSSILGLTHEKEQQLNFTSYNFANEDELIKFFKSYFQS